jgi:hypothetical protein
MLNYDVLWLVLYYCHFLSKYHCFLQSNILLFLKVLQNPAKKLLKSTEISLYVALTNEWNVAKKRQNIDEWFILLRGIILLRKHQLVTSYSLNIDVNRHFSIRLCQIVNIYRNRICQYVNTTHILLLIIILQDVWRYQ